MKLRISLALLAATILLLIWAGCATSRKAYETPDYEVLKTDNEIELRKYPELAVVSTDMDGSSGGANRNGSFGRLFRYISGENETGSKISMTTPVFMAVPESENGAMSFVVPGEVAESGAPAPKSDSVYLDRMESGVFAALRFKGYEDRAARTEALETLRAWIQSEGLTEIGDPLFAYYDPPWTPEFLRRNEVLIRVE